MQGADWVPLLGPSCFLGMDEGVCEENRGEEEEKKEDKEEG